VVRHDQELERTFHIFYQLLAAPDSVKTQFWSHLKGKNNTHFVYVGPTDTTVIEGVSDADQFEKTLKSLAIIGINGALLKTFMQAICVVLQLGNVAFGPDPKDSDHSLITSGGELHELASLMGIAAEKLQTTLTSRVVKVRNEETVVPLTVESAKDSTDALAKQLYDRIFLWLVRNINEATTAGGDEEEYGHIGLLDIFGFESFPVNSFEQLCINFANESLQSKFTKDVFVSVYAEYKDEGIGLEEITYDDNTHVLDLIQNRTGLLAMLNEECIRPNGSDYGFVNKALHANEKSPALIIPRIKNSEVEFGIRHYAGDVMYDATGFVTKNQDTLPTDLMACAQTSTNEIISMEIGITESSFTSNRSMPNRKQSNLVAPTAWSKYKTSLDTLMKNLHKSQSRYIRCVKPNSVKKPAVMEHSLTLQQLRSSGVISAVTLARSAFPNRLEHSKILDRFMFMFPPKDKSVLKKLDIKNSIEDQKEASGILLIHSLKSLQNEKTGVKAFVMGRTKAYFRAGALEFLEATRLKGLEAPAIKIQAVVRGHLVRTAAERRRKKEEREFYEYFSGRAVVIQSVVRMWLAGKERDARYVHFIKAQAKALKKNKKKKKLDKAATEIQRHLRGNYIRFRYAAVFEKVKEKNHLLEKVEKIKKKIAKTKKKKDEEMKKAKFGFDIEQDIKGTLEHSVVAGDFTEISETAHMVELLQSDYKQLQIRIKTQEGVLRPLKKNFDVLMEEQKALRDDYQKAHEKNEAIRKVNKELIEKREADLKKVEELKVELKHLHEKFAPVAHGRVDLQNGLQDILELIRNRCEDDDLVDDVLDVGRKAYSDASNLQEKATSDYQSHLMSSPEHIKKRLGLNKTPTSQSRRASDIVRRKILNNSFGSIGSPGLAVGTPETTKRKKKRESALF
jgi:myosin-5